MSITSDSRISTGYDVKLAKLLAIELIRARIIETILTLEKQNRTSIGINWTGNKTDAIELVFALYTSGNFNNGKAEAKQLIRVFEESFQFKLDNYYDLLKKIRMRKGNRSSFLGSLKETFLRRLDQMDE